MNKELQDHVWSILPKEFKDEVNEIYLNAVAHHPCGYNHKTDLLKYLFGHHNLTSDAEGEEELLTVQRSKVMKEHAEARSKMDNAWWQGYMIALQELFGSKCLPDEESKMNLI